MNKLLQQLLQESAAASPQIIRRGGFIPREVSAPLRRSVGAVEDVLIRPVNKWVQKTLSNPLKGVSRTFIPGGAARELVRRNTGGGWTPYVPSAANFNNDRYILDPAQRFLKEFGQVVKPSAERTAASLRPNPSSAAFPLDDVLTRLGAQTRYLRRQAQTGLKTSAEQVSGIYRNLQGIGPTAFNPLATKTPTTLLGKVGSALNPLNPLNAAGLAGGLLIDKLPISNKDKAALEAGLFTPGPIPFKLVAGIIANDLNNPLNSNEEAMLNKYKNQSLQQTSELAAGAAAEAFRPGAGFPGQQQQAASDPRQRAQDQERSRIAQMSEQDPLFKKYRVAELTKAYNTASPEDKEKIGLEIWATTNPTLARNLKPGQLGYTQATSAVMSQSPLGQFQAQTGDMQYANKMDQVPGAMAGFQPQTPLTGIPTPTVPQFGASEVFAKATPIPGATEMFTDPRKFLSQEDLDQTKLALLKRAYESRLK